MFGRRTGFESSCSIALLGLLCVASGYAAQAAAGELGPLASGLELEAPSWSHQSTRIAVDSGQPPGIFEVEIATGRVRTISTNAYHNTPSFSPRDDTLAFVDKERGGLWLRTSNGGVRELVKGRVEMPQHPWSPDGSRIVFTSQRGLSLVAVQSGEERLLVPAEPLEWSSWVRWAPDGAQLVGRMNRTIVMIDARTGQLRRLEDFAGSLPVMGPRGVIWARPSKSDTSLLRRSVSGETREVHFGESIQAFDVDATAGRVLVSLKKKGVALIDPESQSVSWVVEDGQPRTLSWAPDGKRFALLRWQGDAAGLHVIDVP